MVSTDGKSPEVVAAELLKAWERSTAASANSASASASNDEPDGETPPDTVR